MDQFVSKLGYGVPRDTSVVVNRTTKAFNFLYDSYQPGDIATCTFPTGTDYIDTRRSFLMFEFTPVVDPDHMYMFGVHGSACNIIKTIAIYARSGEELCRVENFNLLSNMMLPLKYDSEWFNRQGGGMWHGDRVYTSPQTCIIPMYILSPLFGYGRLLPAALVSGMRVELTMEDSNKVTYGALIDTGVPPNDVKGPAPALSYTITAPMFKVETVKLGDAIQRAMNEVIATKGVELVYSGWHHTFTEPGHDMQGGVELMISDSYTRALRAFARVRPRENGTATNSIHVEAERDSFRGEHIFPVAEYQWRLGERYYPDQPVGNGNRPIIESFTQALNAVNQYDGRRKQSLLPLLHDDTISTITEEVMDGNSAAGYGDVFPGFVPSFVGQQGSYARDSHVIGVDLTRDSDISISGRPVNNAEPLTLWLRGNSNVREYQQGSTSDPIFSPPLRRLDMFMQYVKLVRVFTNNVEIEK